MPVCDVSIRSKLLSNAAVLLLLQLLLMLLQRAEMQHGPGHAQGCLLHGCCWLAGMKIDVDVLNPAITGLKQQWQQLPEPVKEVVPFAGWQAVLRECHYLPLDIWQPCTSFSVPVTASLMCEAHFLMPLCGIVTGRAATASAYCTLTDRNAAGSM